MRIVECYCAEELRYSSGAVALRRGEASVLVHGTANGTVYAYRRLENLKLNEQVRRGEGLRYTFNPGDQWHVELDGRTIKNGRRTR